MPLDIDFRIRHDNAWLTSQQAIEHAAELTETVSRPWDLHGVWTLTSEELTLTWEDTLVPLISAVCLESLVPLLETGHGVAARLVEYGYLRSDVEGGWIRLGGDDLPNGRVEARPYIEGQLQCAGRLTSLLLALGQDGFDVRALKEDRRAAMRAYAGWHEDDGPPVWVGIPEAPPRREADGPIRLERAEGLEVHCGVERFALPGDASDWLERLVALRSKLNGDAHITLPIGTRYGYFRLDGEGERIRLSGDGLGDLRIPLAPFLQTLGNVALA